MPKKIDLDLPKVDELFTTQKERDEMPYEQIIQLSPSEIGAFPNHPFKVCMDDAMEEMIDSIKQYGVLVPALVRPKGDNGYEMIAGHRRRYAALEANIARIPCVVRNLTDDESIIVMVDSNLQREKILPSEKAFAYKMKLDAMKRQQGERSDLTSATVLQRLDGKTSREILAEQSPDSHEQIRKYIRLTELIEPILNEVDGGKISFNPAVTLSYLTFEEQKSLFELIQMEECTPSQSQANKMKQFSQEGKLNPEVLLSILQEQKPNQKEQIKIPRERISKYFDVGTSPQKIEEVIIQALELYRKRQKSRDAR